ncbi:MAG: hypothetical protein ACOC1K_05010 [Nanoarchaeota archaeon]
MLTYKNSLRKTRKKYKNLFAIFISLYLVSVAGYFLTDVYPNIFNIGMFVFAGVMISLSGYFSVITNILEKHRNNKLIDEFIDKIELIIKRMPRIILVGPSASGKTHLRTILEYKGFHFNVSYTTREMRKDENQKSYNFISKEEFEKMINNNLFYEWGKYNGEYYGTGLKEWEEVKCFVMEPEGVSKISKEDRKRCFIIYIDPPHWVREERMAERGWNEDKINKRIQTDIDKFSDFTDYDLIIRDSNF